MSTALSLEADVLPLLAAHQSAGLWGTVIISFENGQPTSVEVHEKMRFSEQVRSWLRRVTRRPTA